MVRAMGAAMSRAWLTGAGPGDVEPMTLAPLAELAELAERVAHDGLGSPSFVVIGGITSLAMPPDSPIAGLTGMAVVTDGADGSP